MQIVDTASNQTIGNEGVNVIFGAHLIAPNMALPANCVIVNLEQMGIRVFREAVLHRVAQAPSGASTTLRAMSRDRAS